VPNLFFGKKIFQIFFHINFFLDTNPISGDRQPAANQSAQIELISAICLLNQDSGFSIFAVSQIQYGKRKK